MKKIVIIAGLFILITAVVAFVASRRVSPGQSPPVSPTPTGKAPVIPKPTFPDVSSFLTQPSYTIGAVSGTFPSSMPIFTTEPQGFLDTEVSRFATLFHINTAPVVNSAVDGTYYMWSTDPGLIVGPNGQHIDYSASAPTSAPLAGPDSVFVSLGQQLASSVVQWYPQKQTSVLYFSPQITDLNYVSRDKATAIQITYLPSLGEFPLVAGDPKLSETVVRYNAAKTLMYYSGYIYPRFVQTSQTVPIVSLQEASARLVAGQGAILSASSQEDINVHDTRLYRFSLATITGGRLAYYYNFSNKQLSPIYLFTGTAIDSSTQKRVDTVSAVSALP